MTARRDITVLAVLAPGGHVRPVLDRLAPIVHLLGVESGTAEGLLRAAEDRPAVVIVDQALPQALELYDHVDRLIPTTRTVAWVSDEDAGADAVSRGAWAAALRPDRDQLVTAVLGAARGESVLVPDVVSTVRSRLASLTDRLPDGTVPPFSPTELEVLDRMAEGCTAAEIAAMHDVSVDLVEMHVGFVVARFHRVARLAADLRNGSGGQVTAGSLVG